MLNDVLVLLVSLVVILFAAELFTNGIEWMGRKLGLGEGAVGSVLAAVGTALPETLIPIIAIVFATAEGAHEVGVGAILGAPFMLSTLAMFVTGLGDRGVPRPPCRRGTTVAVDTAVLAHDLRYFFIGYGLAIGAAFLPPEIGWVAGSSRSSLLVAMYVVVRQGPPRRRRRRGGGGARAAADASDRPHGASRRPERTAAAGRSPSRSSPRSC